MQANTALAILTAVEGAHAYSAFLPSIFTIRTFKNEATTKQSIRDGELIASLFVLALGAIVGSITSSPLPLYCAIGTIVVMILVYEWALRS